VEDEEGVEDLKVRVRRFYCNHDNQSKHCPRDRSLIFFCDIVGIVLRNAVTILKVRLMTVPAADRRTLKSPNPQG
jgi:hypothetical protein